MKKILIPLISFALLAYGGTAFAVGLTGAIYTTNSTCTGVNVNLFPDKDSVYLDGGPHGGSSTGLPDGSYYAQVTIPSGSLQLGHTLTNSIVVAGGNFATCYNLSTILSKTSNSTAGYDNTTNGGGVYKVWLCTDGTWTTCKTDNFKVKGSPQAQTGSISGLKWQDDNANGVKDGGEPLLSGWTIELWNSGHTGSAINTTQTDQFGFYELNGVTPGTYQVCEVLQATWHPSYPTTSDPNCNTIVVVTANHTTLNVNFGNYQLARIVVHKDVLDPDGGAVTDNHAFAVKLNDADQKTVSENTNATYSDLAPGTYTVTENTDADYTFGSITPPDPATLTSGQTVDVYLVNNQKKATIAVVKNVVAPDGTTDVSDTHSFSVTLNAETKSFAEGADAAFTVNPGSYSAVEGADGNYTLVSNTGPATVGSNGSATITITNKQNYSHLIVIKHVINDDFGSATANQFTMSVTGSHLSLTAFNGAESPGVDVTLWSGSYGANETAGPSGYAKTLGTDCSGTIGVGETKTCTITNNDFHFWMTGGGSVFTTTGDTVNLSTTAKVRVTHGFQISCKLPDTNANVEVNWNDKTGKSHMFHLTSLLTALCTKPGNPYPPIADFNKFEGTGIGIYDGVPGATIAFTFVDNGEPGKNDTASYLINNSSTNTVLNVSQKFLDKGNHQAHQQ